MGEIKINIPGLDDPNPDIQKELLEKAEKAIQDLVNM